MTKREWVCSVVIVEQKWEKMKWERGMLVTLDREKKKRKLNGNDNNRHVKKTKLCRWPKK